jgi:glycosyltransferase involved in cell wall biosynthesis
LQSYSNIEIIIVDDASTDGTWSIVNAYSHHPFIHIYFNDVNIGFAKNFEYAATLAKGEFLAFCDQDDIWMHDKIEKLLNTIGGHSLVYSDSKLIDDNGNYLNKKLSDYRKFQDIYDSRYFVFLNAVSGHTMIARRELLQYALPIPDGRYHDWWFAIQAANLNGIKYLDEVLTLYRQHDATITTTIITKKIGSRSYLRRYADFLRDMEWIKTVRDGVIEKNVIFFDKFYSLYQLKMNKRFCWRLFFFMLTNRGVIFKFSNKKYLSQLFEIRKFARGEQKEEITY